jgi:dTDP-4-dehydrorhamnose reductase
MVSPIKLRPIIILGHTGMLGQMAVKYFGSQGYRVIKINTRFEPSTRLDFMNEIRSFPDAIVINAIGKIKQKTNDEAELLWANAILPLEFKNKLLPSQTLVHPSTDCVFSGKKGEPYTIDDEPDATDSYGWSKRLGELALMGRPNTLIIRVSIIGPDTSPNPKGLLAWFLSQSNEANVNGYTDHLWNGITTLEWCKQAEKIFRCEESGIECKILQLGTLYHSTKYELLNMFQEIFGTRNIIFPYETRERIDRRLEASISSEPIRVQLIELGSFLTGYNVNKL